MNTRLFITMVLVIAFATSCGQVTATPPPTIILTDTRIPPTITPTVAPTVTPTETPIPSFNAQVIDRDGGQTSVSIVVFLVKEGKTSCHSKGLLLGE